MLALAKVKPRVGSFLKQAHWSAAMQFVSRRGGGGGETEGQDEVAEAI